MSGPMDTKALRQLEAAATPGPWHDVPHDWPERAVPIMDNSGVFVAYASTHTHEARNADAALIAAARNALPRLLELAEAIDTFWAEFGTKIGTDSEAWLRLSTEQLEALRRFSHATAALRDAR